VALTIHSVAMLAELRIDGEQELFSPLLSLSGFLSVRAEALSGKPAALSPKYAATT
jgi:hypothetical protein